MPDDNSVIKTSLGQYLDSELNGRINSGTPLILLDSDREGVVDQFLVDALVIKITTTAVIYTVELDFDGLFVLSLPVIRVRDWDRDLDPDGDFFTFAQVCYLITQYVKRTSAGK